MKKSLALLFVPLLLACEIPGGNSSSTSQQSTGSGNDWVGKEWYAKTIPDYLSFGALSQFRFFFEKGQENEGFHRELADSFALLSCYMDGDIRWAEMGDATCAYLLNREEGIFPLDKTFRDLLAFAEEAKNFTDGAIDILSGGLADLWKDLWVNNEGDDARLPTDEEITAELSRIQESSLLLSENEGIPYVTKEGDAILDFGSMGKGYALEKMKERLLAEGERFFLLNAGGSSLSFGTNPVSEDGTFLVGLADVEGYGFRVRDLSVGTSATSLQHKVDETTGTLYSHVVDPMDGSAVPSLTTAVVIGEDAGWCDVLSTYLLMRGEEAKIAEIEGMGYEMFLYDERREDPFVYQSEGFPLEEVK